MNATLELGRPAIGSLCFHWVVLCSAVFAPAMPAAAVDKAAAPQAAPPSSLARYYGFESMEIIKLHWGIGVPIAADINHDGLTDLILINNHKSRIELLLQKKGFDPEAPVAIEIEDDDVNDILSKERAWRFHRADYDLDVKAADLVLADLNKDSLPDLAYTAKEGLYVALQEKPKKSGKSDKSDKSAGASAEASAPRESTFAPARRLDVTGGSLLAAGDLNGDGRSDLAVLADGGVYIVLQKDDGLMGKPVKHPSSSKRLSKIRIADVNADGRDDLVLLTGEAKMPLRVRLQTPAGKLGPEVRLALTSPSVLETASLGGRDCFVTVSRVSGRVQVWALRRKPLAKSWPILAYPMPAGEGSSNRDMVSADVNGDGLSDVVVSDPGRAEFLLYLAKAETSLAPAETFPGLSDMRKLCSGDLTGDGKDSIVALSVKEKLIAVTSLAKGRLAFPKSVAVKGEPVAMDLADLDADDKLDLVYVGQEKDDKGRQKYFLRTVMGLTREGAAAGAEFELKDLKDKPVDLRSADVDHDGLVDVIVVPQYGSLLLVRQEEAGKFSQAVGKDIHAGLVRNVPPRALSLAPLAPGGKQAVLLAQKKFARALVFASGEGKGWEVVDQY
ncbi:MAG: VCBS repeat-containing protein, partial [Planctomycetes bacterium]|nr:VCBS repeat-containing protein [Planctomycetota bacterium]